MRRTGSHKHCTASPGELSPHYVHGWVNQFAPSQPAPGEISLTITKNSGSTERLITRRLQCVAAVLLFFCSGGLFAEQPTVNSFTERVSRERKAIDSVPRSSVCFYTLLIFWTDWPLNLSLGLKLKDTVQHLWRGNAVISAIMNMQNKLVIIKIVHEVQIWHKP